jgi:DNA invertase Pin-like site-specific DNA recombinase
MSTEHQKYSIENQAVVLATYAAQHGLAIVRTYSDHGKSGLTFEKRNALKQLIHDIQSGHADYATVLVFDVSRWGRFQDADESAYYEFVCKEAGITVQYCAEPFENDGSLSATILKTLKRAMAGEYSRELSAKVFAGQCQIATRGFRTGGPAGYGLRRLLLDEHGNAKTILRHGDRKSLQSDRVVLVPGPPEEVETVRSICRWFVEDRMFEGEIVHLLNTRGVRKDTGRPWTRSGVHEVLTNEKYIGTLVFNRVSKKLAGKQTTNPREMWLRTEGAFEPVVDEQCFRAAQRLAEERGRSPTAEEMLEKLVALLRQKGTLTAPLIDKSREAPSANTNVRRFGSLGRAYALIGFKRGRPVGRRTLTDQQMLEKLTALLRLKGTLSAQLIEKSRDTPSATTYSRRFGSLRRTYELISFERTYRSIKKRHKSGASLSRSSRE